MGQQSPALPQMDRLVTLSGRVARHLEGSMAEWQALNVLNYEMESATLFTMCAANGWRAGCVTGVLVNRSLNETPDPDSIMGAEANAAQVVVEAARKLS